MKQRILKFDLSSTEFKKNPYPTYAQLLHDGPVIRSRMPIMGKCWFVTTYDAVSELLRDQSRFVRDPKNAGRRWVVGIQWWMPKRLTRLASNMLVNDGEEHRRLRSLVDQAFQRNSVEQMQPRMFELTDRLLDELSSRVDSRGCVDVVEQFARQLPLQVICELLGLPIEDREQFATWFRKSTEIRSVIGIFRMLPGISKLTRYLEIQIEDVRRNPRPGLVTELVQAEHDGDRLSPDELLSMIFLLLAAGHETTVHLISTGLYSLLQHSEQRQILTNDWSYGSGAVDEILRHASPIQMTKPRMVAEGFQWRGVNLKRGELMIPLLGAANHDPSVFDSPEKFEIKRKNASLHKTFGTGPHVCLGMKLAKAEAQVAFERIFTRFPDLQLGVADTEVQWTRRLGVRGLQTLPIRLNG